MRSNKGKNKWDPYSKELLFSEKKLVSFSDKYKKFFV